MELLTSLGDGCSPRLIDNASSSSTSQARGRVQPILSADRWVQLPIDGPALPISQVS
jgi:hypothetical protein